MIGLKTELRGRAHERKAALRERNAAEVQRPEQRAEAVKSGSVKLTPLEEQDKRFQTRFEQLQRDSFLRIRELTLELHTADGKIHDLTAKVAELQVQLD